jgi:DNA polymerase III epsilon subunit-like protein
MNQQFHNISESMARIQGKAFEHVLEIWNKHVNDATTIVGHNVQYDLNTIQNDIRTYGLSIVDSNNTPILNFYSKIEIKDTMSMNILKKKIKLEELYFNLFNKNFSGAHNALNDVIATKECYFKLLNNKDINL